MVIPKNEGKKWDIRHREEISNRENILSILLKNRNVVSKKEIENFLYPPKPDNLTLNDLGIDNTQVTGAISRIKKAQKNNESVVVYTDYDVDGVSGGTIIWETLHHMGIKVMPYIPDRVEEGYGLSEKGIDKVTKAFHPKLIITVDHGIAAGEKIRYAQKKGIEVIVIDHHVKGHVCPANFLIHTTKLCATGVAWTFANKLSPKENYLDLVALATIADLVPLIGVNRSLVKYGLEKLNQTQRVGLLSLIKSAGLTLGSIGTYEIGHLLAPRINAMGRLFNALDSMRLLCTKDEARAAILAQKLNHTNQKRQLLTEELVIHAKSLWESTRKNKKLIFITHESYNQGIIGLIAGKLVETYYKPAIVVSQGKEYSKASARSIRGFNIIETIRKTDKLLVDAGGHPMAAGFTVKTEHIEVLKNKLERLAEMEITDDLLVNNLRIDCSLDPSNITWDLYENIIKLEPFGIGNPEPVFASFDVKIAESRLIGRDGKHIKLKFVSPNGKIIEAVAFGLGKLYKDINSVPAIDIAYTLDENIWNSHRSLQLKIKDVKMKPN